MSEQVDNKVSVLILQHPQEQDRVLGTARLIAATLVNARVVVGLSWRNLAHAVLIVYIEDSVFVLDSQDKRVHETENVSRYTPIFSINSTHWWLHRRAVS